MNNNNGSRFSAGQKVVSLVSAQGLTKGKTYQVRRSATRSTAFGGFARYMVESEAGVLLTIGNGHLVLTGG